MQAEPKELQIVVEPFREPEGRPAWTYVHCDGYKMRWERRYRMPWRWEPKHAHGKIPARSMLARQIMRELDRAYEAHKRGMRSQWTAVVKTASEPGRTSTHVLKQQELL